ncbi:MAG: hypothetical protein K5796_10405 [Lachnospiraceae bacterium]|nr:hypothetical protein [Lachnospiraceae bacterium]
MKELLVIRDRIKVFVGKNEALIMPLLKFLMTLLLMMSINSKLGYMARLNSMPIALIVSLAASFLPVNLTIVILGLIITAHVYALSWEIALVVLALFMILFLIYYRFASKDAVGTLALQVAFLFKVPAVVPVSMGLLGSPASAVSVGAGVIIRNVLRYISLNSKDLANIGGSGSKIGKFKDIIDALIGNKAMFVVAAAYAITVIIVYIIRRLPIDYCWYIAIGAGSLAGFFVLIVGNASLHAGIGLGGEFLGLLVSVIINIILQFFCFSLDYNKTERVQFEDDEYYYYVKAVPKRSSDIMAGVIRPAVKERPVKKVMVKVPEEKPAARPEAPVRAERKAPTRPAPRKPASEKGIFGFTGGRPAGEGRLKAEAAARAKREELAEKQRSEEKKIEPLSEDDFK